MKRCGAWVGIFAARIRVPNALPTIAEIAGGAMLPKHVRGADMATFEAGGKSWQLVGSARAANRCGPWIAHEWARRGGIPFAFRWPEVTR